MQELCYKLNPDAFYHLHVRDDVDHGNGVLGQLVVAQINRPGVYKTRSKVSMRIEIKPGDSVREASGSNTREPLYLLNVDKMHNCTS